ncbi:hypothetical protein NMY22_g8078 [Coprinellus aureogranulatus]|nr:hypothetical protein NMY22_g8078 [Coprinellus aureogranulatus]
MLTESNDAPTSPGYYLTNFVLENETKDSPLSSNMAEVLPLTLSSFDKGVRRTEQFEIKRAKAGNWESGSAYRLSDASPSVSIQIGQSGRLGGLSLSMAQLMSFGENGGSITRSMNLSLPGGPRQGTRFKLTCKIQYRSQQQSHADSSSRSESLHEQSTASFEKFGATGNVPDLLAAMDTLNTAINQAPTGKQPPLSWLNERGVFTILAFEAILQLDLLPLAASHFQSALNGAPASDPLVPALQSNLGSAMSLSKY